MLLGLLVWTGSAFAAGPFSWSGAQTIPGAGTILGIDCPSTTLCVAGDNSGNVITSVTPTGGAAAWTVTNLVGGFVSINDVDCPATTLCVAVDSAGSVWWSTNPAGGTWTAEPIFGGALSDLDCPTTTLCLVGAGSAGTILWATNPTGVGTWTAAVIDGPEAEASVSCPTPTLCVVGNDLGDLHWTTTPTGLAASWTAVPAVDTGAVIQGMTCTSTTLCIGVDDSGNVLTTTNPTGPAGAWTITNIAGGNFLYNISCPSTTLCVTAAFGTAYTSDDPTGGAATWANDVLAPTLRAVACPTTALCLTGGSSGKLYVGTQATLNVTLAGTGTGTVSNPDFACPPTCTFVYPIGTPTALTATPGSDGSTFSGWSGDCTGTLACKLTIAADSNVTATFAAAPVAGPAVAPPAPPPDAGPSAALPPPTAQKTANVYPTSGKVLVQVPGSKTFVPLARAQQVGF